MSDDSVTILGGAGGAIACMEDLDLLALRLGWARPEVEAAERAAVLMDGLVDSGDRLAADSPLRLHLPGICDPVESTAFFESVKLARAFAATTGLVGLVDQVDDLMARLRLAKANYEQVEADTAAMFASAPQLTLWPVNSLLPWPFSVLTRFFSLAHSAVLDAAGSLLVDGRAPSWAELLRAHHDDFRGLVASAITPAPLFVTPTTDQLARAVTAAASLFHGDGLAVTVERGATKAVEPPTGIEDLIWRIKGLADADTSDSQIGVTKITAADGSISWLVSVPGTQSLNIDTGSNAADMGTNLRAVPGDTNAIGLAAVAAMIDAGVKKGEPVVLTGHSQGGIVSAALAADPDFTAQFSVAAVLTLGSPVSQLRPANSAQWLSLEHTQDIIPALAGGSNARGRNQTTVVRDLAGASDPDIRAGATDLGVAHHAETYADMAKQLDASSDPSLAAWRASAEPVLGAAAAAETTVYKVKRQE
ncbi:MAG: GPI inositol-deacylase [Bifidobacteriaceae bacterium]|jgi:hypothetical protein|nr:GPI inositol-deacylase [Bifidobacteriaceae bacterium]